MAASLDPFRARSAEISRTAAQLKLRAAERCARASPRDNRRWHARAGRGGRHWSCGRDRAWTWRQGPGGAAGAPAAADAHSRARSRRSRSMPKSRSRRDPIPRPLRSVSRAISEPRPGPQLPCERGLLRSREPGRRRRARSRAGRPQPRPPPGLPEQRLRRRLPRLDPPDRLPVHLHLRRLAGLASRMPTAGAARGRSRKTRCPARSTRRSAGRPIITPIMSFLTGPRAWPRTPLSARTSSIAGRAVGASRRPSPTAMPAASPTPPRCASPRSPRRT